MKKRTITIIAGAVVALFLLANTFYVIDEGTQCVVIRFGEIVRSSTTAGLKAKVPFIETTVFYPKKLMYLKEIRSAFPLKKTSL